MAVLCVIRSSHDRSEESPRNVGKACQALRIASWDTSSARALSRTTENATRYTASRCSRTRSSRCSTGVDESIPPPAGGRSTALRAAGVTVQLTRVLSEFGPFQSSSGVPRNRADGRATKTCMGCRRCLPPKSREKCATSRRRVPSHQYPFIQKRENFHVARHQGRLQ